MAAVYKSLSKHDGPKPEKESSGIKRNKQRVLILSSRGVTYRYGHTIARLAMAIFLTCTFV